MPDVLVRFASFGNSFLDADGNGSCIVWKVLGGSGACSGGGGRGREGRTPCVLCVCLVGVGMLRQVFLCVYMLCMCGVSFVL